MKIKYFLFIYISFILVSQVSEAQSNQNKKVLENQLFFQLGYGVNGHGAVGGTSYKFGYNLDMNKRWQWSNYISIQSLSVDDPGGGFQYVNQLGIHSNVYYKLVKTKLIDLYVGGGSSVRRFNWRFAMGTGFLVKGFNDTTLSIAPHTNALYHETSIGYDISVKLTIKLGKLSILLNPAIENDFKGNITSNLRIGLGVKF